MDFQIKPLPASSFQHLFDASDAELAAQGIQRQTVSECPGTPCRVSLDDAQIGETVLLLNYEHLPEDSPYRASHAIFIRENAPQAQPAPNEVPDVIASRLISLRFFDENHMMLDPDVLPGSEVGAALAQAFERPEIAYAHIHNAKPGCFAARVERVSGAA
ncbi:MAG: DUF1203 domain-containing protein [Pseudomonadota bacterium]